MKLNRHRSRCGIALAIAAGFCTAGSTAAAGPDIIHSEIQDTLKYPSTGGPVNGYWAYAWGSYTCNIGNQSLTWVSGGTPALAMNGYRLYNGQLLQIGLGNAKHACCVGNGTGCPGGLTCGTGTAGLRPGCRDVYGAGFNGGQGRLGPRSGINPYDGTFAAIPGGTGDATWRRVKIHQDEMSATTYPGAMYIAEGVYVCLEESPAEQLNNATYRRMTVANSGAAPTYVWTPTGASMVGRPAIYAWQDHGLGVGVPDPSVQVVIADVPNEGRYFVAGKVRDLGNGTWKYEYAVFNLNSHVAAGSFSVGIRSNASVSDIGFYAPDYHSGEIYSNADWIGSKGYNTVRWTAPETIDVNPNTNALRWGTMYNFWFTSDTPPAEGTGNTTLGMFRPFSTAAINIGGLPVPQNPCAGCAADFNCNGAIGPQDIFDFVGDYFAQLPRADFNGRDGVTLDDLLLFLQSYFTC